MNIIMVCITVVVELFILCLIYEDKMRAKRELKEKEDMAASQQAWLDYADSHFALRKMFPTIYRK